MEDFIVVLYIYILTQNDSVHKGKISIKMSAKHPIDQSINKSSN